MQAIAPVVNPSTLRELAAELIDANKDPSNGRIFSLMGPNGTGKSHLLRSLNMELRQVQVSSFLMPPTRRALVPSSSVIPLQLDIDLSSPPDIDGLCRMVMTAIIETDEESSRNTHWALSTLIEKCISIDRHNETRYAKALVAYHRAGKVDEEPQPTRPLLPALEARLASVFDYQIEIHPFNTDRFLRFKRSDHVFQIDALSDGEKQLLLMGLFLIASTSPPCVFLVDEPELYFNEARAVELWTRIENLLSSSIFLYATHNVGFATRPSTSKAYLIDSNGVLDDIDLALPVPSSVIHAMVGARIQILRDSKPLIFCEDKMLKMIIDDIFGTRVCVVEANNRDGVEYAVKGEGRWKKARSLGVPFCGVIDRDAHTEEHIQRMERNRVLCFPYYEAESLLVVPEVAVMLMSAATGPVVNSDEIRQWVTRHANAGLEAAIEEVKSFMEFRGHAKLVFEKDAQCGAKNIKVEANVLCQRFEKRAEAMAKAAINGNIDDILWLFPGKELCDGVITECRKADRGAILDTREKLYSKRRAVTGAVDYIRQLPSIREWQRKIEAALGI